MFNLKSKIKNYGFWLSLTSAIILMLQTIGRFAGFSINSVAIESIVTSICGVLVVLGIISNPESGNGYPDSNTAKAKEEKIVEENKNISEDVNETNTKN